MFFRKFKYKCTEWVFHISGYFVLIIALICIYSILQIKFNIAYWLGTSVYADAINEVIANLSYSYLAGYIFYILTVALPNWKMKIKCQKALQSKMRLIESNYKACAESVLPFPNNLPQDLTKETLVEIFKEFSYLGPCRLKFLGINVPAISYIKQKHEENKKLATELLEYKPWLNSTTIADIEEIRNSNLNAIVISLLSPTLRDKLSEDESSKKILASTLYDVWMTAKKLHAN